MNDQMIDTLKKLIRKQIAEASEGEAPEKPRNMHEQAVELAKAASASLKALQNVKAKAKGLPSSKASAAVSMHLDALEQALNDMWQSPLSYLDSTPDEVVAQRRADLRDRETSIMDHDGHEEKTGQVLSEPTHCGICGATYDKKVRPDCPTCSEQVSEWSNKLRAKKKV